MQGIQGGSRILPVQRQLRLNRRQPKRLHLGVQREAFPQVLRQGLGSCRVARHGERSQGDDGDVSRGFALLDAKLDRHATCDRRRQDRVAVGLRLGFK